MTITNSIRHYNVDKVHIKPCVVTLLSSKHDMYNLVLVQIVNENIYLNLDIDRDHKKQFRIFKTTNIYISHFFSFWIVLYLTLRYFYPFICQCRYYSAITTACDFQRVFEDVTTCSVRLEIGYLPFKVIFHK